VASFLTRPPLPWGEALTVIDATGVGAAVVEMVRAEMARTRLRGAYLAVTITGGQGDARTVEQGRWNVPKRTLVSVLAAVLQGRRLRVSQQQREAGELIRELQDFSIKVTDSAHETFESLRERDHDDLVLALALAVWAAETLFNGESLERGPPVERVAGRLDVP
jgi:hypothetical protein